MALVNEKYAQLFFDNSSEVFIAVDKSHIITCLNNAFAVLTGYPVKDSIKKNISFLFSEEPSVFFNSNTFPGDSYSCSLLDSNQLIIKCTLKIFSIDEQSETYLCLLNENRNCIENSDLLQGMIQAIELSPVSVIIADKTGIIEYVNPGFEKMTGYQSSEVLGKNFSILKYSDVEEGIYRELFETLSRGEVWKGELNNKKKNGELYWESATISPILDRIGDTAHYMKIAENITEYKKMTEMLISSYDFIENVMNSISPVFVIDSDGTFILVNRSFVEQTGYATSGIISNHISEVFNEETVSRVNLLLSDSTGNKEDNFETYFFSESGDYHTITVQISLLTVAEDEKQLVGSFEDISVRKRAEEERDKLSRAVEQSPASVVITSIDGNIEYVNPKFTKLTGYSQKEVLGRNPSILKSGSQGVSFYRNLWETILQGKEWRGEFHNRKKNGELYWEFASISPYRSRDGKVTHFVAVKEDITERKKAEEALKISEESLRAKNLAMLKELQYAQIAVRNMLPQASFNLEFMNSAFRYIPLEAVGGDYFNFYNFDSGRKGIFVGDVAGHGVSAALYLALVKSSIDRHVQEFGEKPAELLKILNEELFTTMATYYLTAIYGYFEVHKDQVEFSFARGGHCPPIIHNCERGSTEMIVPSGKPIGMFEKIEIEERSILVNPGERMYLFTDGLHETTNESRALLDYDGLMEIIKSTGGYSLEKSLDTIISRVNSFKGNAPAEDDIVIIGFDFPVKSN